MSSTVAQDSVQYKERLAKSHGGKVVTRRPENSKVVKRKKNGGFPLHYVVSEL